MSYKPLFPPLDGSVPPIPGFVDFQQKHNGDRPWILFPSGATVSSISFSQFADATHRVAHAFAPNMTRSNGEVVALIINCDTVLYVAMLAGLIRAGFVPFPMSPRNTVAAFVNMMEKTSCRRVISQSAFSPVVNEIKAQLEDNGTHILVHDLPRLHDIFPQLSDSAVQPVDPFPPAGKPHCMDDIVLYLHSSGSTGLPKPIPQRQETSVQWCSIPVLMETRKRGLLWGTMALPTFHTIGIHMHLYCPLATGYPIGLYPPMYPSPPVVPNPNNLIEACKAVRSNAIPIVPAFVEIWAQSEEHVKYLASLEILAFSGGPLSDKNGAKLAEAGVPLFAVYGGTEYGVHTLVFDIDDSQGSDAPVKTSADWGWFKFADYAARRWVPQGDGTYELQFLRTKELCPSVENLPDTRGYATSDLFIPHPKKEGLWKITGRKDDVIVLGNGEKVVPIPQEGVLMSSPLVTGVAMFGRGKNACGVLVEPHPDHAVSANDSEALNEFRSTIWPLVEEANRLAPTFARIFKEMILVTDPNKPLPRAGKGTVVRAQAIKLYSKEINDLYETVSESVETRGITPPASWSAGEIEPWLMRLCASIHDGVDISPVQDMFDQGFDSLHVAFLRNHIVSALRSSSDVNVQEGALHISQNIVYDHPTVRALAAAIADATMVDTKEGRRNPVDEIRTMLSAYSDNLPRPSYDDGSPLSAGPTVLLTGSTGNLGSHILAVLLQEPKVRKVYTLNRRSPTSQSRQATAFEDRELPVELLSSGKLVELFGDVTVEGLGLDSGTFDEVKRDVTHIVHNAWRVDFNLSLASFEKYISGTRHLVDLCCLLPRPVKLLFVSSIAATHTWSILQGPVPEEILTDPSIATATGYGASKFVAENMLWRASQNGINCTSLRVGQVCGSDSTGAWGTSEWIPSVVKSSVALGVLPELDGIVSWIPMDACAGAVVDLITSDQPLPPLVNVVHPRPTPWRTIFQHLNNAVSTEPLAVVPLSEWIRTLVSRAPQGDIQDHEQLPALKLLEFLRAIAALERFAANAAGPLTMEAGGTPAYATARLQEHSKTARTLAPIGEQHAKAWVGYWRRRGFLMV